MLQDIPTSTLREASSCVLETERLTLRRPTLADVRAIAHLANDRRIAENTRRLPYPYLQDHAVEFVRATSTGTSETVQYDNFSATLAPEPASLALIAFAAVLPLRRRRRGA